MPTTEAEVGSSIDQRISLFKDIAIYNSVPSIDRTIVIDVIDTIIEALKKSLRGLDANAEARSLFLEQIDAMLAGDGTQSHIGSRFTPNPANDAPPPWLPNWPWPPIWVGRSAIIDGDEIGHIPAHLDRLLRSDLPESEISSRFISFALVGAAIAVGTLAGKAYNKLKRSSDDYENGGDVGFLIHYINGHGADTILAAATSRPDYLSAIDAMMPTVEALMNDAEVQSQLEALVTEAQARSERVLLQAAAFVVIATVAFIVEVA